MDVGELNKLIVSLHLTYFNQRRLSQRSEWCPVQNSEEKKSVIASHFRWFQSDLERRDFSWWAGLRSVAWYALLLGGSSVMMVVDGVNCYHCLWAQWFDCFIHFNELRGLMKNVSRDVEPLITWINDQLTELGFVWLLRFNTWWTQCSFWPHWEGRNNVEDVHSCWSESTLGSNPDLAWIGSIFSKEIDLQG